MFQKPKDIFPKVRHIRGNWNEIVPRHEPIIIPLPVAPFRRNLQNRTTSQELLEKARPGARVSVNVYLKSEFVELLHGNVIAHQTRRYDLCDNIWIVDLYNTGQTDIEECWMMSNFAKPDPWQRPPLRRRSLTCRPTPPECDRFPFVPRDICLDISKSRRLISLMIQEIGVGDQSDPWPIGAERDTGHLARISKVNRDAAGLHITLSMICPKQRKRLHQPGRMAGVAFEATIDPQASV